ncbi:hypothetical protein ACVSQB_26800 [Bradyrhizobium elkanii]
MAAKLSSGIFASVLVGAAVLLIAGPPPAWGLLLLGSFALAALYVVARMKSRYDPLDPRFGSCIPRYPGRRAAAMNPPPERRPASIRCGSCEDVLMA